MFFIEKDVYAIINKQFYYVIDLAPCGAVLSRTAPPVSADDLRNFNRASPAGRFV